MFEDLTLILQNCFQKTQDEGARPNSFDADINLIQKPDQNNAKKGNHRPMSLE